MNQLNTFTPAVTKEKYAEMTGLSEGVVRGQMEKGDIPTIKVGRRRLVNVAKITQECIESE